MFEVNFSELLVIALVALIVIGPERLPRVARMAGALLGRLRRYVDEVKADVNREMRLDELQRMQQDVKENVKTFESRVTQELAETGRALDPAGDDVPGTPAISPDIKPKEPPA